MMRYIGTVVATIAVAAAGCSSHSDSMAAGPSESSSIGKTTSPTRPTLTAPNLQPPAREGEYVNKGRPDVVFDPCTWISDDTVRDAGYDPATRSRGEDFVAEWTFLNCSFDSDLASLLVMSGNVTLDEQKQKYGDRVAPTVVNGREAVIGRDLETRGACSISMRTAPGIVTVDRLLTLKGRTQGADPCEGIEKTASVIEREIGEGN